MRHDPEKLRDLDQPDELAHGHPPSPEGQLRVTLSATSLLSAGPSPGGGELGGAAGSRRIIPALGDDARSEGGGVSIEIRFQGWSGNVRSSVGGMIQKNDTKNRTRKIRHTINMTLTTGRHQDF